MYSHYVFRMHIIRLDSNVSSLESENQVLRQQALVASTIEELSEETEQ